MKSASSLSATYMRQFMGMWIQVTQKHWLALTEQDRRLAERLQTVYNELEEVAKGEAEKVVQKKEDRAAEKERKENQLRATEIANIAKAGIHTLTNCHGKNVKQITLDELKAQPNFDKEKLQDTVLRGALVDRCCGCAAPGTNVKSSKSGGKEDSDDGEANPNRHWHCIREKNTFLHVECDDASCDICEMRQRAATFDALDSRVGSRNLLDSDDERLADSKYQAKEAPAGVIRPEVTVVTCGPVESGKDRVEPIPMSISPPLGPLASSQMATFQ